MKSQKYDAYTHGFYNLVVKTGLKEKKKTENGIRKETIKSTIWRKGL